MTFFWGAWIKRNTPKYWKRCMENIKQINNYFKKNGIEIKYSILKSTNIDYLIDIEEGVDKYLTSISAIRKGKGIHQLAKLMREFKKSAIKLWEYTLAKDIIGERNSFSKIDPDATFMHMKYDYYNHTNVFKPGYNVQIGVSNGYIINHHISSNSNDVKTYIPMVEEYRDIYGKYPTAVVADAGYGTYDNYGYSEMHGIAAIIKYPYYEKSKEKINNKNKFRLDKMERDEEGTPICPAGHKFSMEKVYFKLENNIPKTTIIYRNKNCVECSFRTKCTKSNKGRTAQITPKYEKYKSQIDDVLNSDEGKSLMANRSTMAEGAFGDIKKNYGYSILRRRGESGVNLEIGLIILGFNLRKYHNKKRQPTEASLKS